VGLVLAENDHALFAERAAGTAVAADSLHVVGLLGDGGYDTTSDALALDDSEQASDPLGPGLRPHDVVHISFWDME